MPLLLLGEHPLAKKEDGQLKNTMGSIFPTENSIVTGPGTHGDLINTFLDHKKKELSKKELDSLEDKIYDTHVPLHMRNNKVLIRPNCSRMDLAFVADILLQELVPKENIKFLGVVDERVRNAVKQVGELWRINSLPIIAESKAAISDRKMYYHNMDTGTRYITYEEFEKLGELPTKELAKYLNEITTNFCIENSCGNNEVRLFMADESFNFDEYKGEDITTWNESKLRFNYSEMKRKFSKAVKPEFRKDNIENEEWRKAMLSSLIGQHDDQISEEVLLGLCPEFFMHIQWLPGARIDKGEVIFDSVFEKIMPDAKKIYDEKVRSIILNFKREYNDIEYINVGRVVSSLSKRKTMPGRREVYIAEMKIKGEEKERVKIIRLQKFGAVERLQSGQETDIYKAFWYAEEYKRYTFDRWDGCEQLGMNLLPMKTGEIYETIDGIEVPLIYFERDYIYGIASDKIPESKFKNKEYANRFARLLGEAAAISMIVGKVDTNGVVHFDDGDEVIVEDRDELPSKLLSADITSSFGDYTSFLEKFSEAYAQPVIKREGFVSDIKAFADTYVKSFVNKFKEIQEEYRNNEGAFDNLFMDRINDPNGSFAYRWKKILERLDRTDARLIGKIIMSYIF